MFCSSSTMRMRLEAMFVFAGNEHNNLTVEMRIVTYNFLRAGSLKRCGHWARVIRHLKPDLVLAQECRPPQSSPGERFRQDFQDAFAWQSAGSRGWGSGLFARSASLVPIAIPDYDGWVVGGE